MKDGEIARTTKELEDLLMANEKKQKSPMEELLAEMESAVARVEKRGPWITTMVPPSRTPGCSTATARSVGQYGSAKPTWMPPVSK